MINGPSVIHIWQSMIALFGQACLDMPQLARAVSLLQVVFLIEVQIVQQEDQALKPIQSAVSNVREL